MMMMLAKVEWKQIYILIPANVAIHRHRHRRSSTIYKHPEKTFDKKEERPYKTPEKTFDEKEED